jgi:hypothetical protein
MAMPGECFLFYFHYGTAHRAIIFAVITEITMSCNLGRWYGHRHLSNIDCIMVHTACLVCFIGTVKGCSKKKGKCVGRCCTSGRHTTKLKQSIFFRNL